MKRECPEEKKRRVRRPTARKETEKYPRDAHASENGVREELARVSASVNREGFRNRRAGPISGTDPAGVWF